MRYRFFHLIQGLSLGLGLMLLSCTVVPASSDQPASADQVSEVAQRPVEQTSVKQNPIEPTDMPTVQADLAQTLPISAEAEIAGQLIQLEVARTPAEQAKGLMYRPVLPDDHGMLFSFAAPRPVRFWMMNTPQPLDMVFLLDGEVKGVIANVPPCAAQPCPTYGPGANVNQVIELRSGRAAELGLKTGDQIKIRFLE